METTTAYYDTGILLRRYTNEPVLLRRGAGDGEQQGGHGKAIAAVGIAQLWVQRIHQARVHPQHVLQQLQVLRVQRAYELPGCVAAQAYCRALDGAPGV